MMLRLRWLEVKADMSIFKANSDAAKKKQLSDKEPKEAQENTNLVAESKGSDGSTEHGGIGKKKESECQDISTLPITTDEQELQDIPIALNEKFNLDGTAAETKQVSKPLVQPKNYKPIKDTNLTIIFLENTSEVSKQINNLNKIVKSIKNGFVCIINYGSRVMQTELFEVSNIKNCELLVEDDIGDKSCLFNALVELENIVFSSYYKVLETEFERVRIKKIEVIGIGRCIDNCSTVSKEIGIKYFSRVSKNPNIVTKYFTLTEESFIQAATIGFRSIGAIYRNYM